MRRKDRERSKEFALAVIDKCEYAVIATVNEDGTPYCVPISIVRYDDNICFHCAKTGRKTDNFTRNPNVCVTCVGDVTRLTDEFSTGYESAIVNGVAEEVCDDDEKLTILRLLCEKYTPEYMRSFDSEVSRSLHRTGVWKISIDDVSGKAKIID